MSRLILPHIGISLISPNMLKRSAIGKSKKRSLGEIPISIGKIYNGTIPKHQDAARRYKTHSLCSFLSPVLLPLAMCSSSYSFVKVFTLLACSVVFVAALDYSKPIQAPVGGGSLAPIYWLNSGETITSCSILSMHLPSLSSLSATIL